MLKKNSAKKFTLAIVLPAVGISVLLFAVSYYNNNYSVGAATESPFTDVGTGDAFYADILWAYDQGITSGTQNPDGSRTYSPQNPISREALAAFLYRYSSSPQYSPPEVSPFSDLTPTSSFYKEICWLYETGVTTSTQYYPTENVTRTVVAAFLYRLSGSPSYTAPVVSPFVDVPTTHPFYTEISWLAFIGITNGTQNSDGTRSFHPDDPVSREATAAFLHRLSLKI